MRLCSDCKYCIISENGYSNYTVEGSDADCLLKLNPDFPEDNWYGDDPSHKFASKCGDFESGDGVRVDVEQELGALENYSEDEEIKGLLRDA